MERAELTAARVKARALEQGFDGCGVAPAAAFAELQFLREWIARGYAGEMAYLERSADRRADIRRVMPSAQSVIVVATVYNVDRPYSIAGADASLAQVARYAWGDDYHDVMKARLGALLAWMRETSPEPFEARAWFNSYHG